jgi:hypothetical protein
MWLIAQAAGGHGENWSAATAFGIIAVVSMISVIVVTAIKNETKKREWKHAERMKAYEAGHPPPEAEIARATAVGFIGTLVPLAALGIGIGATGMLWHENATNWEFNYGLLKIIWLVCGGVAGATAVCCLNVLRRGSVFGDDDELRSRREAPSQGQKQPERST